MFKRFLKALGESKVSNWLQTELCKISVTLSNVLECCFENTVDFLLKAVEWGINAFFIVACASCVLLPIFGICWNVHHEHELESKYQYNINGSECETELLARKRGETEFGLGNYILHAERYSGTYYYDIHSKTNTCKKCQLPPR